MSATFQNFLNILIRKKVVCYSQSSTLFSLMRFTLFFILLMYLADISYKLEKKTALNSLH